MSRMASDVPFCGRSEKHPFCYPKCSPTTASPTSLQKMAAQVILFEPGSMPKEWRHWTTIPPWAQGYGRTYIGTKWVYLVPFPIDGLTKYLESLPLLPDKMKIVLQEYYERHWVKHYYHFRELAFYGKRCRKCTNFRARAHGPPHVDIKSVPESEPNTTGVVRGSPTTRLLTRYDAVVGFYTPEEEAEVGAPEEEEDPRMLLLGISP